MIIGRDRNNLSLKEGDHVLAYQKRFEVDEVINGDIFVQGDQKPTPDLVHHQGVIEYSEFIFSVRLDKVTETGVCAIMMDGNQYEYELATH